jgi:hypothetical protein
MSMTLNAFAQAGPEPDRDGDGVPDSIDRCISEAGPASNNGCPLTAPTIADRDGDGVADDADQCPDTYGANFNNGCPVQETATPEPEAQPPTTSTVIQPTLPTSGNCVAATVGTSRVNVRRSPSTTADIVGVLEPTQTAAVDYFLKIEGVDGESRGKGGFVLIPTGFVAADVLRFGGDCRQVPVMSVPTSTGPFVLRQDADGDGTIDNMLAFVSVEDLFGTNRPDYEPDNKTIFLPDWDDDDPTAGGVVEYAVQKFQANGQATPNCDDILVFDPNSLVPGCMVIVDLEKDGTPVQAHMMCTGSVVITCGTVILVGEDNRPTPSVDDRPHREETVLLSFSFGSNLSRPSLVPELIFVPKPTESTSGDDDDCAPVTIGIGPVSIEGCLILTLDSIGFCLGNVCIVPDDE